VHIPILAHRTNRAAHLLPDITRGLPSAATKFRLDKNGPAPCVGGMSSPEKKPFSFVTLLIDLVLTAIAFTIFFTLIKSHVPSNDPKMIIFWGSMAALCLSGVFWLALQMLKVVYSFQRQLRK
jgi:hypothetical protein